MFSTRGPISLIQHDLIVLVRYDLTALWGGGMGEGVMSRTLSECTFVVFVSDASLDYEV
jgi:hypothetical protein